MFIDRVHLLLQAGDGGKGCDSYYHRTDHKMFADGGDGGQGGSVIFRADVNAPPIATLSFRQHQIAESGSHGGSGKKRGKNGKDLVITVPVGTKIYDRERQFLLRELNRPGDEVEVIKGGRGGLGNQGGKIAQSGEKGKTLDVELHMKLQADIFLVGLPNSGKSSLLNALTRTHVKEEAYPFTTVSPEIGVYEKSDYEQLRLCELPSLYDASHEGRGLGNEFLKHMEEARFIMYMISPESGFAESLEQGWEIVRKQVEAYNVNYLKIPFVVVVNKKDLLSSGEKSSFTVKYPKLPKFFISIATGEGMEELTGFLNDKVSSLMRDLNAESK